MKSVFFVILVLCFLLVFSDLSFAANKVEVTGKLGSWQLMVNGKPFELKGAGVSFDYGSYGEDYLAMAKEMGANTVRTWNYTPGGIDRDYLDHAQKLGLYVASWMWLNPAKDEWKNISYKEGSPYLDICRKRVRRWVEEIKDHPALIVWGVGNEVIFFSSSEEEKIAFAKFLNELCQMIHEMDPNHPVVYASAFEKAFPYLAKYTPDLDIVGINMYTYVVTMHRRWEMNGFDKPYIFTEFGPVNKWGVGNDKNGLPMDPSDWHKAKQYKRLFKNMVKYKGYCLGGFVFSVGELDQWTATWWPLNWKGLKRASYWEAYTAYTGKEPENRPPRINSVKLSKRNDLLPFEEITVEIEAEDPEKDPLTIDYDLRTLKDDIELRMPDEYYEEIMTPIEGGFKLTMPSFEATFILYILVKDNHGNVAIANTSIVVGGKNL